MIFKSGISGSPLECYHTNLSKHRNLNCSNHEKAVFFEVLAALENKTVRPVH